MTAATVFHIQLAISVAVAATCAAALAAGQTTAVYLPILAAVAAYWMPPPVPPPPPHGSSSSSAESVCQAPTPPAPTVTRTLPSIGCTDTSSTHSDRPSAPPPGTCT